MTMVRLIYTSQLSENCGVPEVRSILKAARGNNPKIGVTGLLCYDPSHFMQWIEGERNTISRLYHSIAADPLHANVVLLDYGEIFRREFAKWSMAYVNPSDVSQDIIFRYCSGNELNPYSMSAEAARNFLIDIANVKRSSLDSDI
ncbi:Sensors of blue-light using FAD [Desulfatibacillum alkenivorans DSM 16219]|uniref:Sensors of blue-light using FAD n=1 Tax=Desulfatibacillum alkenivorans DSM 16219 TaxID=1121393 RepID=A0A1M6HG70_9BACT|nr:BLUF domain-containing protein [Desulfatibacillum alkenivorans]SHJ21216.1 Sensors of blue-light using FAD [Desulfatibacillum alkenivorans DSM 16219]